MERRGRTQNGPPEITSLDARIANAGGTTSRLEMLPQRLKQAKLDTGHDMASRYDDLVREIGHLRREIAFYQESRNAMMTFHHSVMDAFKGLKLALQSLSEGMALSEASMLRHWGIQPGGYEPDDVVVI